MLSFEPVKVLIYQNMKCKCSMCKISSKKLLFINNYKETEMNIDCRHFNKFDLMKYDLRCVRVYGKNEASLSPIKYTYMF